MNTTPGLDLEAAAFNQRIAEREAAGLIPDLRRTVKCDYFYKSFWRDPHFVDLYLGDVSRTFIDLLRRYGSSGMTILDVGCGTGYYSLELAREGYHVTAIDIADQAIESAKRALAANPFVDGFGSLTYHVMSMDDVQGEYDAVLFAGVLHHFGDPESVLRKAQTLIKPNGLLLSYEPCHDSWSEQDATQVALIRVLASAMGFWYENELVSRVKTFDEMKAYVREVHTEYVTERDPHEQGQSPNDNASGGKQILEALRLLFGELEYRPGVSFIYRLLGGFRGPDHILSSMEDFLALFDRYSVREGLLRPNLFFFLGRKP